MSTTRITKRRVLLDLNTADPGSASYNLPDEDDHGFPGMPELHISGADFEALGSPEQITVTIQPGDLLNDGDVALNELPEDTLIRATGTYPGGGTFTDCWARPVPGYVSGAPDGSDRLWEVLVFGSGGVDALTTTACITSAEVLYSETDRSTISDGYHTFAELYEYRMLYNAHAAKAWADMGKAVKSWRHSDGEECFGGGWFVVVVDLHPHGQVSNHYPAADWDLFHVPEVETAPEWDGHTPADAAQRLRAALTTPEATR